MISALIGVFFNRPKLVMGLTLAAVVLLVLATVYFTGVHRGAEGVREKAERQNERGETQVRELDLDIDLCHDAGRQWDQHTSTCL